MNDTKTPAIVSAPRKKSPLLVVILFVLLLVIAGLVIKNKRDITPVSNGTEASPGNGIPPDSLHH